MPSSTSSPQPETLPTKHRLWHVGAWITAGIVIAVGLVANIPGEPDVGPNLLGRGQFGPRLYCDTRSMVHGFPWTYFRSDPVPATTFTPTVPWIPGPNPELNLAPLLGNLAVFGLIAVAVGWYTNRWIRTLRYRFGLVHLLVVVALVAGLAGYAKYRHRLHEAHWQVGKSRWVFGGIETRGIQPFGPLWLRHLTGEEYWNWGDLIVSPNFPGPDAMIAFPGKGSVKSLSLPWVDSTMLDQLQDFPNLEVLSLSWGTWSGDLRELQRRADGSLGQAVLSSIAQCAQLKGLDIGDCHMTDKDLPHLAELSELVHLELGGNEGITDEAVRYLSSLKSLRILGLDATDVTQEGIEQLQAALPRCVIYWDDKPHKAWLHP